MSRIRILMLAMFAVFAVGAIASASASAAARCYMVAEKETGRFASSLTCEAGTPVIAKGEWINVKKPEPPFEPGVACAMVETAKTGNYATRATCEAGTPKVAEGEWIRVKVSQDIWQVCQKGGTEKFEEHKCSKKGGTEEWSFKKLEGTEEFPVVSKKKAATAEFKLEVTGLTITCSAVTDAGNIKAGGKDEATTIEFTGCKTGTAKCEVKSAGTAPFGTIDVTAIPTQLEQVVIGEEEILVNKFSQKTVGGEKEFVTLDFGAEPCKAAGYVETKVKGDVAAECKNLANGNVELNFPKPAIVQTPKLEAFGKPATLTGTVEEELKNEWAFRCV